MIATEAVARIEGLPFSALVNLASDLRTFLRILEAQPEFQVLHDATEEEETTRLILNRVGELVRLSVDDAYEHPAEAALAAYLWLLKAHQKQAEPAVAMVLGCRQCWWARKVGEYLRDEWLIPRNGADAATDVSTELTPLP